MPATAPRRLVRPPRSGYIATPNDWLRAATRAPPALRLMLINLLPDFFAVLDSTDRVAAYLRYFEAHRPLLQSYWHNYVLDPDGPHFPDVVRGAVAASRDDLRATLERIDVAALARSATDATTALLEADVDLDVVLMVGVGAANAGELVVGGRGTAFVCLEHFTGVANPDTQGLGLDPELIPLWLSHEIAHAIRYTAPTSRSELVTLVREHDGEYSYWETGRHATLRELLINEGIAVHVSRAISAGHAAWEYFGYGRRQYARVRELESVIARAALPDLDRRGLGLRLRYLSGGVNQDARTVDRYVLPERSGYYLGARLAESAIAAHGLAWTVRASAHEISSLAESTAATA